MTINIGASQVRQAVQTNFQDAALGSVGNLAFAGKPGATPRAPGPSLFQRMGAKVESAIAYVKASPQQRADAQVVKSARQVSADTGALLGALTGAKSDSSAQGKAASALAGLLQHADPLAAAGRSSTDTLVAPSLLRHLGQLSTTDLVALRSGPLGDPASRAAILAKLDPAQQARAGTVLAQIDKTLDKEVAVRASGAPIAALGGVLTGAMVRGAVDANAVDTQAMDAALEQLTAGAGMLKPQGQTLRHFFAPALERMGDADLGSMARGLSQTARSDGPPVFGALLSASDLRGPNAGKASERRQALDALQGAVADQIKQRQDLATVALGTSMLLVPLMKPDAPIDGDKMIRELEGKLGDATSSLQAAHLAPSANANPVSGMLGRALSDLPPAQLDRLLDSVGTTGLRKAQAGIASLSDPAQTALRVAVERAADRIAGDLSGKIDEAQAKLGEATVRGDRSGAALGLAKLSSEIAMAKQFDTIIGRSVAADAMTGARAPVAAALASLRAPGNPDGPLTASSLAGLSHHEIGLLRQAKSELAPLGVAIDSTDLRAAVALRTHASIARAETASADLLRGLADPAATPAQVVEKLRGISDVLAGSFATEMALGEEVSPAHILAVSRAVMDNALAAVKSEPGVDGNLLVDRMLVHDRTLLGPLSAAMAVMPGEIANLAADAEGTDPQMLNKTASLMGVTTGVLSAMRDSLHTSAEAAGRVVDRTSSEARLTTAMATAVAGQFGVAFDADVGNPSLVLGGAQRSALEAAITTTAIGGGTVQTSLPVGGVPTAFSVDDQFKLDAIDRTGISFSVSGRDAGGNRVQSSALQAGMDPAQRPAALGEALGALQQVTGAAAVPLTRFMNQELAGALQASIGALGKDSPIRLADGSAFIAGGDGHLHFDLERHPDGRLSANASITFSNLSSGTGLGPDGGAFAVLLDADASTFVAKFSVFVSDDGSTLTMREPLSLQYTLVETGRVGPGYS